jgi:hypothetical protein
MTYDGFGRQQRWVFPSKTTPGVADPADYEQYLYDVDGNRTKLRKRDGSELTFQYDALNWVRAKIVPERAGLTAAQTRDVYYEYDLRGLQTAASFGGPGNDFVRTWYDGLGRPATILSYMFGQARYLNHQYDMDGNLEHLTHTNDAYAWSGASSGSLPRLRHRRPRRASSPEIAHLSLALRPRCGPRRRLVVVGATAESRLGRELRICATSVSPLRRPFCSAPPRRRPSPKPATPAIRPPPPASRATAISGSTSPPWTGR